MKTQSPAKEKKVRVIMRDVDQSFEKWEIVIIVNNSDKLAYYTKSSVTTSIVEAIRKIVFER
jgi:hypothetical protein